MKLIFSLAALCLALSTAHADLVIEQKVESSVMNGVVTLKSKGTLARIETPTPAGAATMILDSEKGKMTILMAAQKTAMEMDLGALQAQAAALQNANVADVKPTATGAKKKVGDWDAEEYTATTHGIAMHLWVAPNFPDGKALAAQMAKLDQAMAPGSPSAHALGLPGLVVRSEIDTPIGKVTTTLQSAKQAPVDASEFVVPEGYNVVQPPAGFGGK